MQNFSSECVIMRLGNPTDQFNSHATKIMKDQDGLTIESGNLLRGASNGEEY